MPWLISILIALVLGLGLIWYRRKRSSGGSAGELWPREVTDGETTRRLLASRAPQEIAAWLDDNFASREELWPNIKQALSDLGLEGVFLSLLNSPDQEQREVALRGLALVGTVKSLPMLLEALAAKDDELSMEACLVLKKLRLPESAPYLVEALLNPGRVLPARSAEVLLSLGELGLEAVAEALPQADLPGKVRLLELLGEYKDGKSFKILSSYLSDPQEEVRAQVVVALGNLGLSEACPQLKAALSDPYWKVRAAAARALGRLKCQAALADLQKLCADPQWHVRTSAREAIEQLGVKVAEEKSKR